MKRQNLPLIVLGACWLAGACGYACGDEEPGASRRRAGHILHAWDGCTMWLTILDQRGGTVNRDIPERAARYSKRMLEEMIDEEAAAHVQHINNRLDRFSGLAFNKFQCCWYMRIRRIPILT